METLFEQSENAALILAWQGHPLRVCGPGVRLVLRIVDLCVEPDEKHRLRPQSTEGMCDFRRKSEAVQGLLGDLDILNAGGSL
jgi:hypothetical protein